MAQDDGIEHRLDPEAAAVVFQSDGSIVLLLPGSVQDRPNVEVPLHVLAATETLMWAMDEGVPALAEAFEVRVKRLS